ncbi:MAG: histidine phosphatase family protein [Patescibacteria group bacterium]
MKIYIARHGQNEDNANGILNGHRDKPLTELGRAQAYELGQALTAASISVDATYTSPLSRAYETAMIASQVANLPTPLKHALLIERDFGIMTGKRADQIEEICGDQIIKTKTITYFLEPTGAETFPDLLVRAERLLDAMRNEYKNKSLAFFTHGDIGKMLYAQFYSLPWQKVLTNFHFGNGELLVLEDGTDPQQSHIVRLSQYNH